MQFFNLFSDTVIDKRKSRVEDITVIDPTLGGFEGVQESGDNSNEPLHENGHQGMNKYCVCTTTVLYYMYSRVQKPLYDP